ncbi:MAG TPA: ribosomal protein S18-alanine N-acetyltransferase [Bacillota bacterium]
MVRIEPMRLEDLEGILEIEEASFPIPWSRKSFLYELLENERAFYLVAREEDRVQGYIGMWMILDEGHITNLAVHPRARGRGIGELLLKTLMAESRSRGIDRLTLEVRVSNLVARSLYAKLGFVSAGIRPGYYLDNNEDALIMWRGL